MRILDLPLKAKWYDMIESGIKTEEYRKVKPYWTRRLLWDADYDEALHQEEAELDAETLDNALFAGCLIYRPFTHVRFRYGYTKRTMLFELKEIVIGKGNLKWGAPEEDVFILKLGNKEDEK